MINPYNYITETKEVHITSAQSSLHAAYMELLRNSDYSSVTVKTLCQNAHVARSTFYAYYQNIDEILEEIENDLIRKLLSINQEIMQKGRNKQEDLPFYRDTLKLITDNKISIYLFLITKPNYRFINKWKDAIKYHFWERLFKTKRAANDELILEMIASVAISAYVFWLKKPYEVDERKIESIVSNILQLIDYKNE